MHETLQFALVKEDTTDEVRWQLGLCCTPWC
jgi:hypothetical protein